MLFHKLVSESCVVLILLGAYSEILVAAGPDSVQGRLTITVEDYFTHHRSKTRYFIKDQTGRNIELFLASEPRSDLRTGTVVKASGRRNGASLESANLMTIEASHSSLSTQDLPSLTPSSGNQTTLIYNLTSATGSSAPLYSNSQLNDILFASSGQSVNTFYQHNSFGTVSFSGTVSGAYAINVPAACDTDSIQFQADQLATAAGVDIAKYAHHVYMLPQEMTALCSFGGLSTVGRTPSAEWINTGGYFPSDIGIYVVLEHELGHGLSMQHAETILVDGTLEEYGDNSDVMGDIAYLLVNFDAPHLIQEGWIPLGNIQQVNVAGTYSVNFAERKINGTQALQVAFPGTAGNLYVSYLQPTSSNADNLPAPFLTGASIHYWDGGFGKTRLATNYPWGGALNDGQTFLSTDGLVSIKQISHNGTSVVVQVDAAVPLAMPVPFLTAVNSASGGPAISPGSLASIYLIAPALPTMSTPGVPYPQTLGGVEVKVNGVSGSLLYVSPTQINFQVPAALETPNSPLIGGADIAVYFNGQLVAERHESAVAQRAVGMFTVPNPASDYEPFLNGLVTYYINGKLSSVRSTVVPDPQAPGTFMLNPISTDPALGEPYLSIYATGVNGVGGVPSIDSFANPLVTTYSGPQGEYPGLDQINLPLASLNGYVGVYIIFIPGQSQQADLQFEN